MAGAKCQKCSNATFSREEMVVDGTKYYLIKCSSCGSVIGAYPQAFWHIHNAVDQIDFLVREIWKKVFNVSP